MVYTIFTDHVDLNPLQLLLIHNNTLLPSLHPSLPRAACLLKSSIRPHSHAGRHVDLRSGVVQAYEAAMHATTVPQLVVAKMDIPRFTAVNTAKGPWSLLSLLATTPEDRQATEAEPAPPPLDSQATRTGLSLEAIQGVVRDVAAAIIGETLEGKATVIWIFVQGAKWLGAEICSW